jgi:hypothetical protein
MELFDNVCGKKFQSHRRLWADCLEKMWEPRRLTSLWASTACYRDSFTFTMGKIVIVFGFCVWNFHKFKLSIYNSFSILCWICLQFILSIWNYFSLLSWTCHQFRLSISDSLSVFCWTCHENTGPCSSAELVKECHCGREWGYDSSTQNNRRDCAWCFTIHSAVRGQITALVGSRLYEIRW